MASLEVERRQLALAPMATAVVARVEKESKRTTASRTRVMEMAAWVGSPAVAAIRAPQVEDTLPQLPTPSLLR